MKRWNILYRGSLSSCNYGCVYCPFAKTKNTREELALDNQQLQRFSNWVKEQKNRQIGVLFTPWGEALIHRNYQKTLCELSHLDNVYRISIQTNLSCRLDWLDQANWDKLSLWTTYHPTQTTRENFLKRCLKLHQEKGSFSVGVVGLKEHFDDIKRLREELPDDIYLWVNAYKREKNYYSEDELQWLEKIDPNFRTNTSYHPSLGEPCQAGSTSFSVDGDGTAFPCHFIKKEIGNIYHDNFRQALQPKCCVNETCGCHIGYVHLDKLKQADIYGDGLLNRIPISYS